jgi:predicted flap endonuclease-1-like 5' DNA nuclease
LISVPALLLLGVLLGWALHAFRAGRPPRAIGSRLAQAQAEIKQKEEALHAAETELAQYGARLQTLNKAAATTRQQVEDSEEEHKQLLMILDEWQASIQSAQDSLHTIRQGLQARSQETDDLISTIDKSLEEMDLLKKMQDSYQVKTNRLTQQVQWQDSELRMLRHTVQSKTSEISEARALLEQRDAELRLLIRQRQQREIDIANARKALTQRDNELRRMLGREGEPFVAGGDRPPRPLPGSGSEPASREPTRRVDVTPALPSTVSAGKPTAGAESEDEDDDTHLPALDGDGGEQDITVIPRLADYYANQLRAKGIATVRQLAEHSPDELRTMLTIPGHHSPHIENWVKTARRLSRHKK